MAKVVLDTILEAAEQHHAQRVVSAKLRIGELTLLNPDQLVFWMRTFAEDSIAKNLRIEVEKVEAKVGCGECGYEGPIAVEEDSLYHVELPILTCPRCGNPRTKVLGGKELEVKSLEIDVDNNGGGKPA